MDFDHTYSNGASDWNFPSPTRTPTTGSFNHHAFHTPKTATFSSHFNDAFSTPQMPSYATPRPADYATMTPIEEQQKVQEAMRNQYYAQMQHTSGPVNNGQTMPPPIHTPSQQYQGPILSPAYAHSHGHSMPPGSAMSFDTLQMQTPPPTRGTSAKKADPQLIAFGTPSTIASRRFATPQQAPVSSQQVQNAQYAPMPFPQLQFPPDVYQFGNMGPASAPVYPQTQLSWEQTASPTMYGQQHMLDDPFAPVASSSMGWPTGPSQQSNAHSASFNTPTMVSFPTQMPMQRPSSAAPIQSSQRPHLSPPVMTAAGVDPSLVYSSPIRPVMPVNTPQSKQTRNNAPATEPKRKDSAMATHKRTDTVSTSDSIIAPAPKGGLRRSNTTGTARPSSAHPSIGGESAISRSNSVLHAPRTASPLKRIGKLPLGSISEKRTPSFRRSVILTIDETGTARTETLPSEPSPTKSIRDRYPGLFDSDSSDEESEEEDKSPSRSASFSFTRGEDRKSKAARLDPPIENLEGLNIPRSSSSASMKVAPSRAAIAAAAQLRRGGSLRKQTPNKNNGQRRSQPSASASIDTAPMDLAPDRRQDVVSPEDNWTGNSLEAHNRRWSMMSLEQHQASSISPTHPSPPDLQQPIHYPPSGRRSQRQGGRLVRCTCGIADEQGQALVQCRSCTQWCHAACLGLNPASLPSIFTCFLCTKPTTGLQMSSSSHRKRS